MPGLSLKRPLAQASLLVAVCLLLVLVVVGVFVFLRAGDSVSPGLDAPVSDATALSSDELSIAAAHEGDVPEHARTEDADRQAVFAVEATSMAKLRGRVESGVQSNAIEGAEVTVRSGESAERVLTDAAGSFEVEVREGVALDVEATAEGYNPGRRAGVSATETLVLRLERAAALRGVILGPGAADLKQGVIRVWADDSRDNGPLELTPDGYGRFEIPVLEPGEFDISADVVGWSYGIARDVIVRHGKTTHVELELTRAGSALARVVFEGTRDGVAACDVTVSPWVQGLTSQVEEAASRTYTTDAIGWVKLDSLNPGENRVQISAREGLIKRSTRLVISSAKREEVVWEVSPLWSLSGVVTVKGAGPVREGHVTMAVGSGREAVYLGPPVERAPGELKLPRSVPITSDGAYVFDFVPAGQALTLSAVSAGAEPVPLVGYSRVWLRADAADSIRGISSIPAESAYLPLSVAPVLSIWGVVQDSDGVPLAGAKIDTSRLRRGVSYLKTPSQGVETDVEGRFRIENLLHSEGWISAELEGYTKNWERVELTEEPTNVTFVMEVASLLKGRVEDLEGNAVPWARVSASKGSSRSRRRRSTRTDEFGRFRFKMGYGSESLEEGEWEISAWTSGYEGVDRLKVTVPSSAEILLVMQSVRVPDAATLRGRAVLPDGRMPRRLRVDELRSAAISVDGGEFKITGLSPGVHGLVLEATGCAPRSLGEVQLSEGEDRDLGIIEMFPGVEVEVVVRDQEGQRLSDARVRMEPRAGYAKDAGAPTQKPGRSRRRGSYPMGELELGTWELEVRVENYKAFQQEVELEEGSERRLTVEMEAR